MDHPDFIVCGVMENSIDLKRFFFKDRFSLDKDSYLCGNCMCAFKFTYLSLFFLHYVNLKGGVKTHFKKVLKSEYPTNYGTKCQ